MSKTLFEISNLEGITFEGFLENVRETENLLCKVQDTLIQLEDNPEELDVALKNIEKNISKLYPEIKRIVRRGITRIRMNPNTQASIEMLQNMIDSCEENFKKLSHGCIETDEKDRLETNVF